MSYDSNLVALFQEIAPAIGATLKIEPNYRRSGMLEFSNGSVLFFRNSHLNINAASNARMARDKSFLSHFLSEMGFRTLPEITVSRYDLDRGAVEPSKLENILQFAALNGWRAVVKPNGGSQGRGIRVTNDRQQLLGAIYDTLTTDGVCILQQYCGMPEYRLVVLKEKVIQAYRRSPMTITGDGSSTLETLLKRRAEAISQSRNEDISLKLFAAAVRIFEVAGRDIKSVPPAAEQIVVGETANLSAGGEATDVMELLHPHWKELAIELAKKCGLLLCGIDIFIHEVSSDSSDYRVIEINSAPGLDDYTLQGEAQKKRVLALYREVLETAAVAMSFAAAT